MAAGFDERRWAVENACGLGRHLAQWPVARGEVVDDVPSTATARVRELSRGGRRKNDVIDAAAAASVAALGEDASPVVAEDLTAVLALLDERRENITIQRTRLVNQLHAVMRDLVPGGAPNNLSAAMAARLLIAVRPVRSIETTRKQLARDLVAEIRGADQRVEALAAQLAATIAEHGSRLAALDGVGPVAAARLLGRIRRADRFPSASAFANYAGVAPIEVASGDRARHRLPRGGDRQLNYALHIMALTPRADSAYYCHDVIAAARRAGAWFSVTARLTPAVTRAIAAIDDVGWTPIHYPNAIWDDQEQRWVSDAEVAEIPFTAFTGRRRAEHVTARLIVRRVRRLNPSHPPGRARRVVRRLPLPPGVHRQPRTDARRRSHPPRSRDHRAGHRRPEEQRDRSSTLWPVQRQRCMAGPRGDRLQPHLRRRRAGLALPRPSPHRHHPRPADQHPRPGRPVGEPPRAAPAP